MWKTAYPKNLHSHIPVLSTPGTTTITTTTPADTMYIWTSLELLHQQEGGLGGQDPSALISALTQEGDVLMEDTFWDMCRHSYPALQGGDVGTTCYKGVTQRNSNNSILQDENGNQQLSNILQNQDNFSQRSHEQGHISESLLSCVPLRERRLGYSEKLRLDVTMATTDATSQALQYCIQDMTEMSAMLSPLPLTPKHTDRNTILMM